MIWSDWVGTLRWGRNRVSSSSEVRNDTVRLTRLVDGAVNHIELFNDSSDAGLAAAAHRAERLARLGTASPSAELYRRFTPEPLPANMPSLFFDATYQLDAEQRAAVAHRLIQPATAAGVQSAGYIAVGAHSMAALDTLGHVRYVAYTTAQCSMTVRDVAHGGSGWAGGDSPDWTMIDGATIAAVALEKCVRSRNPVALEPARYVTILEPQAVCDFVAPLLSLEVIDIYEHGGDQGPTLGPFAATPRSYAGRKGERVIDERLTISADPTDPALVFPPFNLLDVRSADWPGTLDFAVYHPATWIERGVLTNLAYDRDFALSYYDKNTGLPNSGAFRMSGGTTSVSEMIATTERGVLVTRLSGMRLLDRNSILCRGYTRDGLWLIEHGKVSKAVKNMVVTESVLSALNRVEQLGPPQRVFRPKLDAIDEIPHPAIVPPLKIRDFSFTALTSAV